MKVLFKRTLLLFLVAGSLSTLTSSSALAMDEESSSTQTTNYSFTVIEGDNTSLLVRKAVSSFAADNSLDLNNSQKLYIETNVAHEINCAVIHPGQELVVPHQLLSDYSESASSLNQSAQDAWGQYAANANFDVSTINNPSLAVGSSASTSSGNSDSSSNQSDGEDGSSGDDGAEKEDESGNEDDSNDDNDSNEDSSPDEEDNDEETTGESNSDNGDTSLLWWIVGGGALIAGWVYLNRQEKKQKKDK